MRKAHHAQTRSDVDVRHGRCRSVPQYDHMRQNRRYESGNLDRRRRSFTHHRHPDLLPWPSFRLEGLRRNKAGLEHPGGLGPRVQNKRVAQRYPLN